MPLPNTTRSNIWKLTLEIEDTADLAEFAADPDNAAWPLVDDYETMYRHLRRSLLGLPSFYLTTGGQGRIVKLSLEVPDDEEFLTARKFRNQVKGEREAAVLRTELPQDATAALRMVLSAHSYLWEAFTTAELFDGGELDGALKILTDAALEIEASEDDDDDLRDQAEVKWQRRKKLGMLAPGWRPA